VQIKRWKKAKKKEERNKTRSTKKGIA